MNFGLATLIFLPCYGQMNHSDSSAQTPQPTCSRLILSFPYPPGRKISQSDKPAGAQSENPFSAMLTSKHSLEMKNLRGRMK